MKFLVYGLMLALLSFVVLGVGSLEVRVESDKVVFVVPDGNSFSVNSSDVGSSHNFSFSVGCLESIDYDAIECDSINYSFVGNATRHVCGNLSCVCPVVPECPGCELSCEAVVCPNVSVSGVEGSVAVLNDEVGKINVQLEKLNEEPEGVDLSEYWWVGALALVGVGFWKRDWVKKQFNNKGGGEAQR